MILGRLPFRTPFKDEYQRQRMQDQIQKGLGSFHEREMSGLTTGKQNYLCSPSILFLFQTQNTHAKKQQQQQKKPKKNTDTEWSGTTILC